MISRVSRIARALLDCDATMPTDELVTLVQIVCVVRRIDVDAASVREVCSRLREQS